MLNYFCHHWTVLMSLNVIINVAECTGFGPGSDIWPFLALANFWPNLADFSIATVIIDNLQLKVMKLVFACHHLSDLMVWCIVNGSRVISILPEECIILLLCKSCAAQQSVMTKCHICQTASHITVWYSQFCQ